MATKSVQAAKASAKPATSNVVKLPTAASRKVHNWRYSEQRAAGLALRDATAWPGEYIFPGMRARMSAPRLPTVRDAAAPKSPELLLAALIFDKLDAQAQEAIRAQVQELFHRNDECAEQLLYWIGGGK